MFSKQSLKNKFMAVQAKLETKPVEVISESELAKSSYPKIHASVRGNDSPEENLALYLNALKTSFKKVHVPNLLSFQLEIEEELSEAIMLAAGIPCFIQLHHPKDMKGYDNMKMLIEAIQEHPQQWRLILKNQNWVSLNFIGGSPILSLADDGSDTHKLEGLMKSICLKSSLLTSFNVRRKDGQLHLNLKLEAHANNKISTERDAGL